MFSNFLYFLIALVIYSTSELFDPPEVVSWTGLYYSLAGVAGFGLICWLAFRRLDQNKDRISFSGLDQKVNKTITRLSVLALVFFALNIYWGHLNHLLSQGLVFRKVPTLGAVVLLGLFLVYLMLIWNTAFQMQKRYFPGSVTRKSFVFSNIAFALPALLPWFCLSLFADMIGFLPFEGVKAFFDSTSGEVAYILFFLAAVSLFGPVLIQKLWGCTSLDPGIARQRIEETCARAGLKYRDILQWELFGGSMITAGVMGLVGRFRYILVTPALLRYLDDDEIQGVMIHEIGHVQRYHMVFYLFFFLGFIACNFVFFEPMVMLLYVTQPLYAGFEFFGVPKETAHPVLICASLILAFLIYFRGFFGVFMRNFERQADLHIFNFHPSPSALISTFYKIASMSRQSIDAPNWHHYSIGQRIRFLEACRESPGLIPAHHSRVKKMMAGYALFVAALFFIGFQISYGQYKESFDQYVTAKIISQELELTPENSDLYVYVGDYFYGANQYAKAVQAYENVLRIDPDNVHALNNLAWLLATCPEERFQDPERSLDLAKEAASLDPAAHVLDTYAEALFINHRFEDALAVAQKALGRATEKHGYYQDQVIRFEKALDRG